MARVLVTRPEPGATHTLNAILNRGIEATAIPLTEIQPLAFDVPVSDFDAFIITSQNAVRYGAELLALYVAKPVFVVGKRSAETFKGHKIAAWAETALDLLPAIISQTPKNLLYICGKTRRPDLEIGLKAAGIHVKAVEVYRAKPAENTTQKLEAFFASTQNAIVLLHAPSAAELFVSALKGQKIPETARFLCMSAAIAVQLPSLWQNRVSFADKPDEAAMINQLDKMLARDHMPKA